MKQGRGSATDCRLPKRKTKSSDDKSYWRSEARHTAGGKDGEADASKQASKVPWD